MKTKHLLLAACLSIRAIGAQAISVSPTTATVAVGSTKQLTRSSSAIWASSDTSVATVSNTGLVKAKRPGKATISVSLGGLVARSVITVPGVVVVTPPPPPPADTSPPPVVGGVWRSHEPSGMTSLAEQSFASMGGWGNAGLSIAADPSAPRSPPGILRVTYPGGSSGGSAPGYVEANFSGRRVFYLTYWAKLSANFYGHPTGFNKQFYVWASEKPIFFLDASGGGDGNLSPKAVLQNTPADAVLSPNLAPTAAIPRGRWYNVEILLNGNSSGSADGVADWWIDGAHVGSVSGLRFTSAATAWEIFTFRPVWGGAGGTVPQTMTLDLDHVYMSGKN